jgi:hypothetical protein
MVIWCFMDYNQFHVDMDEKFGFDFDSLPDGFDMDTAVAMLRIVASYSQHWQEYYKTDRMLDSAKEVIESNDTSEIFRSDGAALGASIVRSSLGDDWAAFLEQRLSPR